MKKSENIEDTKTKKKKPAFVIAVKWLIIGYAIGAVSQPIRAYFDRYKENLAEEQSKKTDEKE